MRMRSTLFLADILMPNLVLLTFTSRTKEKIVSARRLRMERLTTKPIDLSELWSVEAGARKKVAGRVTKLGGSKIVRSYSIRSLHFQTVIFMLLKFRCSPFAAQSQARTETQVKALSSL